MDRFGTSYTARVASFGTLAELATIEEIGRGLRATWEEEHPGRDKSQNPWAISKIDSVKKEFTSNPEHAIKAFPEIFHYYDGLLGTRISQSVHPAGMIISPINLDEEYGVFDKDNERCLVLDMGAVHDVSLAKYDFLILKSVTVIRDTCNNIGTHYPKTHEINWDDQEVWADMLKSPGGLFQFEGDYAFKSLKQYRPQSIFDMSLVTAAIRPSGASYRDALLMHKHHSNPSELIDDLLKNNHGYLVYQEDIIAFLQKICGLSGSYADTVRRGIARKKPEILEEALPKILDGYCSKSEHEQSVAEKECSEFLQIISDASAYMFGYNHSIAYCLLGYLCAYYRYYHPIEFITAFLNNAANDDDIRNGTLLAKQYGIAVTSPKYGISRSNYSFDRERNTIAKGMSSIKFMSGKTSEQLYEIAKSHHFAHFSDLLDVLFTQTAIDTRQLSTLIHIDFFSDFGNQRELEQIVSFWELFKRGDAKQIRKDKIAGSYIETIVARHSNDRRKDGSESASYTLQDVPAIICECEDKVLSLGLPDYSAIAKSRYFNEAMGYNGFISNRDEDRAVLMVRDIYPVKRKRDGKQFGYNVLTQSLGSGIESRFTIFNGVYQQNPIRKGDVIRCLSWERDGKGYFTMKRYALLHIDDDLADVLKGVSS